MNVSAGHLTGVKELDTGLTSFYRLRSEMLDSFADIERSLLAYVSQNNQKSLCVTAPLGQKIDVAKKIPAGPRRSKELKVKADTELAALAEMLPLRADMVHSRMEMAVTTSSKFIAIFKNTKDVTSDCAEALVFTCEEFERFVSRVKALERSLTQALAAQNPQPKPKA